MAADATRGDSGRVAIEAFALALLTALPLVPYFLYLREHPIGRFELRGDYAGLELATRYVSSGRTLLGPYSRFGFNHPGPLYFYALAPLYGLWGSTSTGILAGAAVINASAAMTIVGAIRLAATRAHAMAATLVVLGWLGAFGDVCALPWNPLVVVLPMIAFLVLAALVANGTWNALPVAVLAGAFVAETHLSTVPTVLGVSVAIAMVVAVRARRGHALDRRAKTRVLAGLAVLALAVTPPVIEQLLTPTGNITKLARFFSTRTEPLKPLRVAVADWAFATSWLPGRLRSQALLAELEPEIMRSVPTAAPSSLAAFSVPLVLLGLAAAAGVLAFRRRDHVSVALVATGGLASVVSVGALRAIIGADYMYLLFWTTAATTLLWIGIASTCARMLADLVARSSRASLARAGVAVATVALFVVALGVSSLQRGYLSRPALVPPLNPTLRDGYAAVRARLAAIGATPVFHADAAGWDIGMSFLLESAKDGVDARVVERERWIFGRQPHGIEGLARPLHVFVQTREARLAIRECLEKLATVGEIEIYTSDIDVVVCPVRTP